MAEGRLVMIESKRGRLPRLRIGEKQPVPVPSGQLSPKLSALGDRAFDGREVVLDLVGGQPQSIRTPGDPWRAGQGQAAPRPAGGWGSPQAASNPRGHGRRGEAAEPASQGDFHNPYSFVPAPPRGGLGSFPEQPLGDGAPVGHDRYAAGCYSGRLTVKLTTETPLLLPDAARAREDQKHHRTFPVRRGRDGRPYLAPTAVKGMLRAAYEEATNSRFGVFRAHGDRLAYRMPASEGLALVPARVVSVAPDSLELDLLPGFSTIGRGGTPSNNLMYAAWLPCWRHNDDGLDPDRVRYPNGADPSHGDEVDAWVEEYRRGPFRYWRTRQLVLSGQNLGAAPTAGPPLGQHVPVGSAPRIIHGWVCRTGKTIDRKHDERIFFVAPDHSQARHLRISCTGSEADDHCRRWRELMDNYRTTHDCDRAAGRSGPPALRYARWGRHIDPATQERLLAPGTLCYAQVEQVPTGAIRLLELYPVMISRKLYRCSPEALLPASLKLRPATSLAELSPADRVFGWVNGEETVKGSAPRAYRGQLRIGPVRCQTSDAIEDFAEPGVPLAILGEPKPAQARFYVARSVEGSKQRDGISKEAAVYEVRGADGQDKGLRGRKVYPHHQGLPDGYWDKPVEDRTQQAVARPGSPAMYFQEYRRPHQCEKVLVRQDHGRHQEKPKMKADGTFALKTGEANEQRDDQNRSVLGWVRPGAEFSFDIDVLNLTSVELGALLWLLTLPEGYFHRLGGGKPLGFGSVRLALEEVDVQDGRAWAESYRNAFGAARLPAANDPHQEGPRRITTPSQAEPLIGAYRQAIEQAYGDGKRFEQVSFIAALRQAMTGFSDKLPVHYPRARQQDPITHGPQRHVPPHPDGLAYEWFVANERTNTGPRLALPDLASDRGLPLLDR